MKNKPLLFSILFVACYFTTHCQNAIIADSNQLQINTDSINKVNAFKSYVGITTKDILISWDKLVFPKWRNYSYLIPSTLNEIKEHHPRFINTGLIYIMKSNGSTSKEPIDMVFISESEKLAATTFEISSSIGNYLKLTGEFWNYTRFVVIPVGSEISFGFNSTTFFGLVLKSGKVRVMEQGLQLLQGIEIVSPDDTLSLKAGRETSISTFGSSSYSLSDVVVGDATNISTNQDEISDSIIAKIYSDALSGKIIESSKLNYNKDTLVSFSNGNIISVQEFKEKYEKYSIDKTYSESSVNDYLTPLINFKLKYFDAMSMPLTNTEDYKKDIKDYCFRLAKKYDDKVKGADKSKYELAQSEFRDSISTCQIGLLIYAINDKKIWSNPSGGNQKQLEDDWIKSLMNIYKPIINENNFNALIKW